MTDSHNVIISSAVEGDLDEAVLRRLVKEQENAVLKTPYGKSGKSHLRKRLASYNQAARFSPWIVLMDLDHDADCAPLRIFACVSALGVRQRAAVCPIERAYIQISS